ncbi:VOC family protein [Streptomyces sp. YIM 98790]|uniref:VOC family protein n=1 Tax=Streptomyces sp. YIM 98790 TaxID=2689077 RepID=UPI00140C39F9|nr:VOC family protein [Streptomyces sp. YIM 98790]
MRMIFVNLPVKDLDRANAFYKGLGFSFNPQFSDDKATCVVIDDNIFVMLLKEEFFQTFINGEISDATTTTEVLNALSANSREEVDELVAKALASGGKEWKPVHEDGPMYGGSFQDPDGHVWEVLHMDMSQS